MKKLLFLACIFCAMSAVNAMGQASYGSAMSAEIDMFQMPDHTRIAEPHDMAREHDLRGRASYVSYSQGERPLWELVQLMPQTPLGDSARAYRQEHALVKKAPIVWVN
jgi:hypothetical protein